MMTTLMWTWTIRECPASVLCDRGFNTLFHSILELAPRARTTGARARPATKKSAYVELDGTESEFEP